MIDEANLDIAMNADCPGATAVEHAMQKLIMIKAKATNQARA